MIGKIIGAALGAKAAEHTRGVGGAGGALLGVSAAAMLRRMSLPAMLAVAAGGYAFKRYKDRQDKKPSGSGKPKVKPSAA